MELLPHHPEVKQLLQQLLRQARAILNDHFVGMYLFGSLTSGDFDQDSDIDVLIATREAVSVEHFVALEAMHARLYAGPSPWAIQLEVSYIPLDALRRYDPTNTLYPHIDRGSDAFFMMQHDESWIVQRHVLRQRGITLAGPAPRALIDPVSPQDLRQAMVAIITRWSAEILADPTQLKQRGGQTYSVLTLCRILYTLKHGTITSKPAAARWAQEALDSKWTPLIERTWVGRRTPSLDASPEDIGATLAFIRFVIEESKKFGPAPQHSDPAVPGETAL